MSRFHTLLASHRAMTFVAVTFSLTWIYEFAVVYPIVEGDLSSIGGSGLIQTAAIAAAMFAPAIGVLITRLITGEGFKNCVIKPYPLKKSLPWFLVAWFGPSVLVLIGVVVYFMLFPADFDPNGTEFARLIASQLREVGASAELPMGIQMLAIMQIAVGTLFGPVANFFTCFGEEWGWRGYLMPKLGDRMRIVPALVVSGIIWGLWHAPLTALGHNYGIGYLGWPFAGIIAMCCFCTVVGVFLSYVTIRILLCNGLVLLKTYLLTVIMLAHRPRVSMSPYLFHPLAIVAVVTSKPLATSHAELNNNCKLKLQIRPTRLFYKTHCLDDQQSHQALTLNSFPANLRDCLRQLSIMRNQP